MKRMKFEMDIQVKRIMANQRKRQVALLKTPIVEGQDPKKSGQLKPEKGKKLLTEEEVFEKLDKGIAVEKRTLLEGYQRVLREIDAH